MKRGLFSRILISLLGASFILWGAMNAALDVFGEQTTAVITHVRREGGERADVMPNRYTYNISYAFTLPNGKQIHGFTKRIGDGVYLKADGAGRIDVRYFSAMPYINAPEANPSFSCNSLILSGTGIFLMVQRNRRKS